MKKLFCLFLLSFCLVGCSFTFNINLNKDDYSYLVHERYSSGNYDYTKRGYYVDTLNQPDAPYYYIITMGEKNTGGYSIEVENVDIDSKGNAIITVKENSPSPEANVTMAFTYPAVCVEVNKAFTSVKIVNTTGQEFKLLD